MLHLRKDPATYPHIEVAYSSEKPLSFVTLVVLEKNGITLYFDSIDQSLRLITVDMTGNIEKRALASYKGIDLNRHESITFKQIYNKVFGPTYPGHVDHGQSKYILSYPGLSFSFNLPANISSQEAESMKDEDLLREMNGKDSPTCSTMAIFRGTSWVDAKDTLFATSTTAPLHAKICAEAGTVDLAMPNGSVVNFKIKVSTMQDVFMALGAPDERVFKRDSRLSIHNPDGENEDTDLFFNYFGLGIDVDFDTSQPGSPIRKLIFHGNVPNSSTFQKYNRCRWTLVERNGSVLANSESDFNDCSLVCTKASKPMVLNRISIDSPSSSIEILGDAVGSKDDEPNDWGTCELYGIPHCIFEVLKNRIIASVVIY